MHYILQTIAFQLLFLIVYDLFLKKETFFNTNRLYLLFTPLVSLVLPFIQIAALRESIPPEYMVQLPTVIIGGEGSVEGLAQVFTGSSLISWQNLWLLGVVVSFFLFIRKILRIFKLKGTGTITSVNGLQIVKLPKTNTAFTFLNNIFLGEQLSEEQQKHIVLHERVHIIQKHSWDLLFFELLRLLFWFNPLIYLFQNRMTTLHEFIADHQVATQKSKSEYYQDLLAQVFQTEKISFINTFFNHSLIKKRIVMLQKSKSKKIQQLKYLLLVPILAGMLFYTSCSDEVTAQDPNTFEESSDSEVLQNIANLKESIAKKGYMTKEEEDALKVLYVLTNPNGLETNEFQEVKEQVEIPFGVIEKVPVFPGCEGKSSGDAKKCFTQKITEFVIDNFNTKVATPEVSGKQRIALQFKVNLHGEVENVKARAQYPELQQEAIRVINLLPKMTPGEQSGKKVGVIYSLPILFEINE